MRLFLRQPENRLVLIYLACAALWLFLVEGLMAPRWLGFIGSWATHAAYAVGSLVLAVVFIWHNGRRAEHEATSRKLSETQISRIFNTAADAIVVINHHFQILQFNPSAEKLYGYRAEEVVGQSVAMLLPPAHVEAYRQRLMDFMRAPETVGFFSSFDETYGRRKDGTEFPADGSISKLGQNGGQTYVFILRDVSERRRVDDALRSIAEGTAAVTGDDFFRSLVRHLAAALQVRYAFVAECTDNAQTRVRTLAFWMGRDFGENFDYALAETPCAAVIGGEICYHPGKVRELFPNDLDLVKLDAESYLGIPLRDARGNIIGHLAALDKEPMADPTRVLTILNIFATRAGAELERNRAAYQLTRTAQEREALNQMGQAVVASLELPVVLQQVIENTRQLLDAEDIYVLLREGEELVFAAVGGLSAATLHGYRVTATTGVAGQVLASGQAMQGHCGQHNLVELGECHDEILLAVPLKLGSEIIGVMEAVQPRTDMANAEGLRVLGLAAIWATLAIDNARRHAELSKALQQEKATRAQLVQSEKLAAMGRLVASVAHEINNPLQAIQNALYLINQEPCLAELSREYLQVAITEGDRMAELVSRLRETYRPATSESFEPESLNALVTHIHKLIATHLRHSRVEFEFNADADLPIILGNRDQLKQALLNLCLNAVDAMPNGGTLTLNTYHHAHLNEVWLTVADTGVGIAPAALSAVFEPFFTTKPNGTGLGLAITHDIVQQHAGRIEVESAVGLGTTFTLRLPAGVPALNKLSTAPLHLEPISKPTV